MEFGFVWICSNLNGILMKEVVGSNFCCNKITLAAVGRLGADQIRRLFLGK